MTISRNSVMLLAAMVLLMLTTTLNKGMEVAAQGKSPVHNPQPDAAALWPFQTQVCLAGGPQGCGSIPDSFQVPFTTSDGQTVLRLVIEYVSGTCTANLGSTIYVVSLNMDSGTSVIGHRFVSVPTDGSHFVFAQDTRLYMDPGWTGEPGIGVVSGNGGCVMSISGHLVAE